MSFMDNHSGIFAACYPDIEIEAIRKSLAALNADIHAFPGDQVVLASFTKFPGQGIWADPSGGLCYDVDLTNEIDLKKQLSSDTMIESSGHLLWLLYRKFGTDFIDHLRGAFSFALWDKANRMFLVATDAFGIRPVVYTKKSNGLIAASRIRMLFSVPDIETEIDPEAIYHYLFFHAICSPLTIYKSIRKLEPGNAMLMNSGVTKKITYYDIKYQPIMGKSESYWKDKILSEVENAVSKYVSISNPQNTGCFLSGGTDSSSIAGFFTRLSGGPAKTFSIGFDEPAYNELDYAHIASRHFGTEQHDYYVTPEDVLNLIETLPNLYDEPFGNSSVVPAYYCALLAMDNGVNRLLGGDGGDEIFGGNERYVKNLIFSIYHQVPGVLRNSFFEPLLNCLPDYSLIFKAKRYVRRANFPNPDRFFSYNLLAENSSNEIFQPEFLESVDADCFLRLAREHYRNAAPAHDTDRLLYLDMKFTITDNDLRKVTHMAETAGVRVRYPLLDRDLVDFSATIPATLKVKWGKGRYIFKRAMEGFLPAEIITKKKHGMGLPIAYWFKKGPQLFELLNDTLFSGKLKLNQWVRPAFISRIKSDFLEDETSYYGSNLWVFLMLEIWLRKHL